MNITDTMEENIETPQRKPGLVLAELREEKGLTQEYVASKLHLRVRIIELIEADDYENMPEPVFIKGYIRAYAKLMEMNAEPLLETYNLNCASDTKIEKALWQSRRESNKAEKWIRWFTLFVALSVVVAIGLWWQKNRDSHQLYSANTSQVDITPGKAKSDIRLTDLSKMETIMNSNTLSTNAEKKGG